MPFISYRYPGCTLRQGGGKPAPYGGVVRIPYYSGALNTMKFYLVY
jgi:hypothetical protein